MSLIMTKAALALKNAESNFQFVKFEAYKSKKKRFPENVEENIVDANSDSSKFDKKDLELKKIRHDVVKFGMSGFDANKKQEAKIALAVSLGAKPPPKPYINYKELMQKRKEEKALDSAERQQMISKSVMHKTGQKKKKTANNDVGHFLSSYGKIQKKDLKKKDVDKRPKKKKKTLI